MVASENTCCDSELSNSENRIWVIPYQFSKSSHMTSLELDETWYISSPSGIMTPVGV